MAHNERADFLRFILPEVCVTGRKLGEGTYGSVEELEVNGLVCAGKRPYEHLTQYSHNFNFHHLYQDVCQVTSAALLDRNPYRSIPVVLFYA